MTMDALRYSPPNPNAPLEPASLSDFALTLVKLKEWAVRAHRDAFEILGMSGLIPETEAFYGARLLTLLDVLDILDGRVPTLGERQTRASIEARLAPSA